MTAEDATDIPEGDKEHQTDQQDEAHKVNDAFLLRSDLATTPDQFDQHEEQAPAVERRQRQQVQHGQVEREDDAQLRQDEPHRKRAFTDQFAGDLAHSDRTGHLLQRLPVGEERLHLLDHELGCVERLGETAWHDLRQWNALELRDCAQRRQSDGSENILALAEIRNRDGRRVKGVTAPHHDIDTRATKPTQLMLEREKVLDRPAVYRNELVARLNPGRLGRGAGLDSVGLDDADIFLLHPDAHATLTLRRVLPRRDIRGDELAPTFDGHFHLAIAKLAGQICDLGRRLDRLTVDLCDPVARLPSGLRGR